MAAARTLEAIRYRRGRLEVLNQLLLPHESVFEVVRDTKDGWAAIREMKVRGAPAIAIVAALSLAIELTDGEGEGAKPTGRFSDAAAFVQFVDDRLAYLRTSRPTAVNLFEAADRLQKFAKDAARTSDTVTGAVLRLVEEIEAMLAKDIADNRAIGMHGARAIQGDKVRMLTHCNTGSLATAGFGTALGVIRALRDEGRLDKAFFTETRPYNQGARLTAYEMAVDGIPATLVCDSAVPACMRQHGISAVVVGADRVVANGDTANKIGTYMVAIAAHHHGIPFYVAAPTTSIDPKTATGDLIHIEERPEEEVTHFRGQRVVVDGMRAWNPSFDVTPASLITGIVTELGVIEKAPGASEFDVRGFLMQHGKLQ